jgi:hypothetical protein
MRISRLQPTQTKIVTERAAQGVRNIWIALPIPFGVEQSRFPADPLVVGAGHLASNPR